MKWGMQYTHESRDVQQMKEMEHLTFKRFEGNTSVSYGNLVHICSLLFTMLYYCTKIHLNPNVSQILLTKCHRDSLSALIFFINYLRILLKEEISC